MFKYAEPWSVAGPDECFFYHSIDLPGLGEVGNGWDLRPCAHEYLGKFDFQGKRALDVGAASGFLSFEMERRGAEVVSYDLAAGSDWNIVPHFKVRDQLNSMRVKADASADKFKRAYWLAHRLLGSKAQAYYGDIYNLPKELGEFDVAFYGMILTHLRDPFQALYSGARLTRDAIIVTGSFSKTYRSEATFRPNAADTSTPAVKGWWYLSLGCIKNMLGVLGFSIVDIIEFEARQVRKEAAGVLRHQAIVARRSATAPGRGN